ncbi:hypothetical protein GCM10011506_43170 [Marivirga lumbricoides]|uniref:Uncharacterized protein n=1 Tax=Marivirga lumbricoides TaxID=1046115 RepID=A0ABQ1N738_9BACT|nr:hypothetical protein GCM10011506_43170 [Marivirga lumbricoides]
MKLNKLKIITIPILGAFIFYWVTTIFFNLPDNYIKLQFIGSEKIFNSSLFQKWSFFAPPPKHNDRLYYSFHSKDSSNTDTIVLEVVKPIIELKRKEAPFNARYEVMDYILNNSMIQLNDFLVDQRKRIEFNYPDSTEKEFIQPLMEFTWNNRDYLKAIQTLANYGEIVAVKNNIDLNKYHYKFYIVNESIKSFSDRSQKDAVISKTQSKIFESPLIKKS